MADIVNFPNGSEDGSCCPYCDIRHYYLEIIETLIENGKFNVLKDVLNDCIQEAKEQGQRDLITMQLAESVHFLKHLDGECECEE